MSAKTLLVIVGPTAIGKTALAIDLANKLNTEIISADSRQFYKEMAIGTAKPTPQELSMARHHLVDFLSIHDEYSAGNFEQDALKIIDEIFHFRDTAIMVGGSGMYIQAVCDGLDDLPASKGLRDELNNKLKNEGIESLQKQLFELDPQHYHSMDIHNPQRLIRALEVCILAGKPYSQMRKGVKVKRNFKIVKIGLKAERDELYERINKRVDIMVEEGLIEEVKRLLPYRNNNALITVGYREIFEYLDGNASKEDAIELIKRNTRRFAKRQMTWFRRDVEIHWFDYHDWQRIEAFFRGILSE